MVNINLLPKEIIERQKFKMLLSFIVIGGCIFVCLLMSVYVARRITLVKAKIELNNIEKQLQSLKPVVEETERLKKYKTELERKRGLVERLVLNGLVYPKFMVDLLRVLPDGVWLISMNTSSSYEQGKITNIKVMLSCASYDKISIADFLSNLENSTKFKNSKLGPINISQQGNYELHNFTVEFNYTPD